MTDKLGPKAPTDDAETTADMDGLVGGQTSELSDPNGISINPTADYMARRASDLLAGRNLPDPASCPTPEGRAAAERLRAKFATAQTQEAD